MSYNESVQFLAVDDFESRPYFVPLHFRSRERKVHKENFRDVEHSLRWNFRSSGANVPRTCVPMKLAFHENEYSKNFRSKCRKTRPESGYKPYNSLHVLIIRRK